MSKSTNENNGNTELTKAGHRLNRAANIVLLLAVGSVIAAWLFFYLIDVRNAFGLRDVLLHLPKESFHFTTLPFFFEHWFRNGGPGEIMQWLFLGVAAILSAFIAGRSLGRSRPETLFWGLLAIALVLMLIEDAGDPRHTLRSYVQAVFGEADQGRFGTLFEFFYFLVLAAVPIYALRHYGMILVNNKKALVLIIIAFVSYALATLLSFLGIVFYVELGSRLHLFFVSIGDEHVSELWSLFNEQQGWECIGYYLMDSLVEESIELIGAASFASAALAWLARDHYQAS